MLLATFSNGSIYTYVYVHYYYDTVFVLEYSCNNNNFKSLPKSVHRWRSSYFKHMFKLKIWTIFTTGLFIIKNKENYYKVVVSV